MVRSRKTQSKRKPPPTKVPNAAEIITAQALAHPDLGPQRLALLLKSEGIDISKGAIYQALRRRGLQTRELRRRFLSKSDPIKSFCPDIEILAAKVLPEPAIPTPPPAEEDSPFATSPVPLPPLKEVNDFSLLSEEGSGKKLGAGPKDVHIRALHVSGHKDSAKSRGRWVFHAINFLLAGLVVLLATHIMATIIEALKTPSTHADALTPDRIILDPPTVADGALKAPLKSYRVIMARNLFGARVSALGETLEAAELAKIELASAGLGLKLIGTTIGADKRLNQAVIESTNLNSQDIYREQERAGTVLIKRILRNNVIIETENGEQRLTVGHERVKEALPAPAGTLPAFSLSEMPAASGQTPAAESREHLLKISRDSLTKWLANPASLLKEVGLVTGKDQPAADGLRLGVVRPKNPLARLGLRTGDIIREFDGETVSGVADVEAIFNTLTEGGEFKVLIDRRGRPLTLSLSID